MTRCQAIKSIEQMEQKAKRQRGNPRGQKRAPHVRELTSIQHRGARERPVEAGLMGLPASSLPRLLRSFINFTIHTLFFPPCLPSFPLISARLAGLRLTEQDAEHYHRRLLHISIKFCLSGRPNDLPWWAGEEAGCCTASSGMDTVHSHV